MEKLKKRLKKEGNKSRSRKAEVNLSKLNKLTKKNDVIAIPGKVLGNGSIEHALIIGAEKYSKSAKQKIESAGGKALGIKEVLDKKNVRLIK